MTTRLGIAFGLIAALAAACGKDNAATPTAPTPAPPLPDASNAELATGESVDFAEQQVLSSVCHLFPASSFRRTGLRTFRVQINWRESRCGRPPFPYGGDLYNVHNIFTTVYEVGIEYSIKQGSRSWTPWQWLSAPDSRGYVDWKASHSLWMHPNSGSYIDGYVYKVNLPLIYTSEGTTMQIRIRYVSKKSGNYYSVTDSWTSHLIRVENPKKPNLVRVIPGDGQATLIFNNRPTFYDDARSMYGNSLWQTHVADWENETVYSIYHDRYGGYYVSTIKRRGSGDHIENQYRGNYDQDGNVSLTITGLENGNEILLRLYGYLDILGDEEPGFSNKSDYVYVLVTPVAAGAPEQPRIDRTEVGHRSVTITWAPPLGSTVTHYQVRHRTQNLSHWPDEWMNIPDSTGDTFSHTWTGLENGTMYEFQVRAVNDVGAGFASTAVSRRPQARLPEAPTITDVVAGNGWIRVEWQPPAGYEITRWQSRIKEDAATTWPDWHPIPASDSTEHTFRGLTNGVRYAIQIRGKNSAGEGAWSTPVRWRPRPPR